MLNASYLSSLRTDLHSYQLKRREIIKQSGDALHHAKRAIFALHRDNSAEAKEKLGVAGKLIKDLEKKYKKTPDLLSECSLREALEEYVEAYIFLRFIEKRSIGKISGMQVPTAVYLAGLCDVPGELLRYAIKAATTRDGATVSRCNKAAGDIIGLLIECDLTSYLRNKCDQAKQAARKLEQVVYELSLVC